MTKSDDIKKLEKPFENNIVNRPQLFFVLCGSLLLLSALIGVAVFFIHLRGAEEVMVIDVQHKGLAEALIMLQDKDLYPRIQLRFSESAADKGTILEQRPKPGTIVKAGRRINLVVSQGVLLSAVGNYVGRDIDDVRSELKALFGSSDIPLLAIKDPLMYQFSNEMPGTIIEQDPPAGKGISGRTEISLVVSRGLEVETVEMPMLTGLTADKALELINKAGIRYEFKSGFGGTAGTVVSQEPAGGDSMPDDGTAIIVIAEPPEYALNEGDVFNIFEYKLPQNPYPMQTVLEVILSDGKRKKLVEQSYKGGNFTYPYTLPRGSILVLSSLGREVYREIVR
jgi:beta-lactam-binding protein with PASTA domain